MGSQNPHWQSLKYLQHYTEHTRICTQIKCSSVVDSEGNDRNPITAYKEAYYAKNPIDTSRSGVLARISGITKKQAETVIAYFDYTNYLANYHPPKDEKKTPTTIKSVKTPTTHLIAINLLYQNLTKISYADLKTTSRSRSYFV